MFVLCSMFCLSSLSEYHTISLFRVTELFLVFAEVMAVKKCVHYTQSFEGICPVTDTEEERTDRTCPDPMGVQKYRQPS